MSTQLDRDELKAQEFKMVLKQRLEAKKIIWSNRGAEARKAYLAARPRSWVQMKGMEKMMYELNTPGTKPFAIGFGITALGALYIASNFTDEDRANSEYWQQAHGKADNGHHH